MSEFLKKLFVGAVGLFSALYLLNPTLGVIELISDLTPVVGNLDEAAATTLLVASLAYFGVDVTKLFGAQAGASAARKEEEEEQAKEKSVDGKVV